MYPPRLVLSLVALLLMAAFAGCIKAETEGPVEVPLDETLSEQTNDNATLPDDRGQSAGILETNKTEEGVGGVDHKHDYWAGRETVELLKDRFVYFTPTPVYPDGDGTAAKSVAYVKLPCTPVEGSEECVPALVYEGAEKVTVTAQNPTLHPECEVFVCPALWEDGIDGVPLPRADVPHPSPPKFFLQYRSAADSEWREPVPLGMGQPVEILVGPRETDMPHSVRSLWVFRLTTDQAASVGLDLSVTVTKGRDVVDWPGHPDFYAETPARKVADRAVKTEMSGIKEGVLYDGGGTWAAPDKLISHGTTRLVVIMNVTGVTTATGQQPTGFFLEYHNATIIGPEIQFGERLGDADFSNDLQSYNFEIPVDVNGMDGPYQPASRWGFRLMATFTDVDVPREVPEVGGTSVGLCPACFEYTIDYNMVVIAIKDPEGTETAG